MTGGDTGKRTRGIAVAAGVTVLAVGALTAYLVWPRTPDHVLVVGDSVTYLSWDAIDDRFGAGSELEALARPGFTAGDLLPLAEEAVDARADAGDDLERAILLVGYNDVWRGADDDALAQLVALSARHDCAVWLTLPTAPGGEPAGTGDFDPEAAEAWNERLAELVAEHDNLHLVTAWQEEIEAGDPTRYLEPDGIHPTRAGQELLARTMDDGLRGACRFP